MRVHRYGERALLVELDDPSLVAPLREALAALETVDEAVAGAVTVLASVTEGATASGALATLTVRLPDLVARLRPVAAAPVAGGPVAGVVEVVEVPVVYDGPDLAEVAAVTGLSEAEVVALHTGAEYTVRFCGFSPGFAYLDGLDPRLHVPRRAEPRTAVPAGAVAVAGGFAAVYPRRSPGGWQLLGTTGLVLWDAERRPPALLRPGSRVRFRAVGRAGG